MDSEPVAESTSQTKPFDVALHTIGLPGWLVTRLEQYLNIQQRNWRPLRRGQNTQRFWSGHLRMWRFFWGQCGVKQIDELKPEHVFGYIDARLTVGRAASSINTDLSNLRTYLRFLQEDGLSVNSALLQLPGLKQPDCLPRALTAEQVCKLRDEINTRIAASSSLCERRDALMAKAAFTLLWQGGLRLGELEELCLEDVDLPRKTLIIRNGKGDRDRVVYLSDAMVAALQNYLALRGAAPSRQVFLYREAPLKRDLLRRCLKAAGEQAGVIVRIHGLRHTCATQLLNAGCPITSIQAILGHKKLNTTMIYAHAYDQTVAEDYFSAMSRVEQRLDIVPAPKEEPKPESEVISVPETQVLFWIERLAQPELCQQERLEIAENLKQALCLNFSSQLSPPIMAVAR